MEEWFDGSDAAMSLTPPAAQHEPQRGTMSGALTLGSVALYGLAIVAPTFLCALTSGDLHLSWTSALIGLGLVAALGAVAAFRATKPTRQRAIVGSAFLAVSAGLVVVRYATGKPIDISAGCVLLAPIGVWLLGGWKAGLLGLALGLGWMIVAFS